MRRFFIACRLQDTMEITGQDARHIGRVLRLKAGDEILVADRDGRTGRAIITSVGLAAVSAALQEIMPDSHEPPVSVWLAQGLTKGDKLEYIVQKAVEIGAAGVIPLATDHITVEYDEQKQRNRRDRWQKIAHEAAKQCGRGAVPAVEPVRTIAEALAAVGPETAVIMLYEGEPAQGLKEILADCQTKSYLLLIGPEGGFSPAEADLCREHGVRVATLGPRILRTETAALAALAIVMYEKGDLGG